MFVTTFTVQIKKKYKKKKKNKKKNKINSLVFSKLFYCSSMWASATKKNIARLQKVQNFAARIVTGTRKYDHITPILKELHWLSVAKQLVLRDT